MFESTVTMQLNEKNGGKLIAVHVSGKLTAADYDHFKIPSRGTPWNFQTGS